MLACSVTSGHLAPVLWCPVGSTGSAVVEVGFVQREATSFLQVTEGLGYQGKAEFETQITELWKERADPPNSDP